MSTRMHGAGLGSGARASFRRKATKRGLSHGAAEAAEPAAAPEAKDWEYDRRGLSGLRQVGQGNFGVVYIGMAERIVPGEPETAVAVKTLMLADDDDDEGKEACRKEFLSEAKIMKAVSTSEHVVRLLGVCCEAEPYWMIMEFMANGDLKEVLRSARPKAARQSPFGLRRMALMGADIAAGMHYLSGRGVVHRDLAARNCMVGEDLEVKVGDFGLTRKTYASEYYRMKHSAPLPIRWMAFECLMDGVFTSSSDLWSFGIVLWEIFSFGKMPYDELENGEVVEQVCENDFRLPAPKLSPPGLHPMMLQCWEEDPEDRGAFADRRAELTAMAGRLDDAPISRAQYKGRAAAAAVKTAADLADEAAAAAAAEEEEGDDDDDDDDDVRAAYDQPDGAEEPAYAEPVVGGGYATVRSRIQLGPAVDAASIAGWVAATTGRPVDAADLHGSLRDGQTLCWLMNKLKPGAIRKVHASRTAVKQMENIDRFLTSASDEFGLEMFAVPDLFDDDDMLRVLSCLAELREHVGGST